MVKWLAAVFCFAYEKTLCTFFCELSDLKNLSSYTQFYINYILKINQLLFLEHIIVIQLTEKFPIISELKVS